MIEGLAAQGKSNAEIHRIMGGNRMNIEYITRTWRHTMRKPDPAFSADHQERVLVHAERCMAAGGFPAALRFEGGTVHVYPQPMEPEAA